MLPSGLGSDGQGHKGQHKRMCKLIFNMSCCRKSLDNGTESETITHWKILFGNQGSVGNSAPKGDSSLCLKSQQQ